jgi:guanosine-3',5'-bis(diphosphate) 3'-pyrophosphohydrolase
MEEAKKRIEIANASEFSDVIQSLKLRHRAWLFAARAHEGEKQLYPGTNLSYLTHIAEVVMSLTPALIADRGLNADLATVCAILHDTVEDTPVTLADLEKEFGLVVAKGVGALTKRKDLPKGRAMEDSLERILAEPREISAVKLADRISNLGPELPLHHWDLEKCWRYAE